MGFDGDDVEGRIVVSDVEFELDDRDDVEFVSVLVIETTVLTIS